MLLGDRLGLDDAARSELFYVALLHGLGCVADAHDAFILLGADDLQLRREGALLDRRDPRQLLGLIARQAGGADRPIRRPAYIARALAAGPARVREGFRAHCELAAALAGRLGAPESVRRSLLSAFERWDGHGISGTRGDDIPLATRIVEVARLGDVHFNAFGPDGAVAAVGRERGRSLDPTVAEAFRALAADGTLWGLLRSPTLWQDVLELEPRDRWLLIEADRLDDVARAFGDFADLKSPWTIGHAPATARLAEGAAKRLGLPASEVTAVRRAALLQDLGRVGLPNTILEASRPLGPGELERVRLHPYYTERILARTPTFATVAALAGSHHERPDGSGYHRGNRAGQLTLSMRVLAAADAFQAMTEPRPYRAALSSDAAARTVSTEAHAGRLDPDAATAVVEAARGVVSRPARQTNLSERELEVLRLAARGATRREIAARLTIAEKTVGHHLEHIYDKLGVSTRAAAVMEGMTRGLLY